MDTNQFFPMDGAIWVIIAVCVIFVALVALFAIVYNNWKKQRLENIELQKKDEELKQKCQELVDALQATRKTISQNETSCKTFQKEFMLVRHRLSLDNMSARLGEMSDEIELAKTRGSIDEKEAAVLANSYASINAVIKNLKSL